MQTVAFNSLTTVERMPTQMLAPRLEPISIRSNQQVSFQDFCKERRSACETRICLDEPLKTFERLSFILESNLGRC